MTYGQYFRLGILALLVLITKAYDIISLKISALMYMVIKFYIVVCVDIE